MGVLLKFHPQCTNTSSWVPTMCQAFHIYCQTPKLAQSRQWIKVASFLSHSDSVSFHVKNERGIQSLICSDSKRSSYYFHFIDENKEVLRDELRPVGCQTFESFQYTQGEGGCPLLPSTVPSTLPLLTSFISLPHLVLKCREGNWQYCFACFYHGGTHLAGCITWW